MRCIVHGLDAALRASMQEHSRLASETSLVEIDVHG